MTRDLDTMLRDAVATTPVDTAAVLDRAATIRRRRTGGRIVAALAVLAVVGVGVTSVLGDEPVAPIVGTDPVEVEGALAPVLEAEVVDPSLPLLRVDVDVADVPQVPDLGERPGDTDDVPHVLAVGPDGTWVATLGRQLVVGDADGTARRHAVSHVATAAVLPDGSVLAGLAASPGAPIDRLAHVRDGELTIDVLTTAVPTSSTSRHVLVQDPDRVTIAVRGPFGAWQELEVWTAAAGVVVDAALTDVPRATSATWERVDATGADDRRSSVGRGDGLVLQVGRSDRTDAANMGAWSEHVVGGRLAQGLGWLDEEPDLVSVVTVLGPGHTAAAVPVRLPPSDDGWSEVAEPLLSVDGALWLRTRDGAPPVRIVPAGGLPGPTDLAGGPAPLPEAVVGVALPDRTGGAGDVVVVEHGGTGAVPATPVTGRELHAAHPGGCCWVPSTISPDGTLAVWAEPNGLDSRGRDVQVVTPEGAIERVSARDLYGTDRGPALAFDDSGNLWALADRWWSHAGFPDLVVRRPGEGSFTSLGHLPLDALLGSDAGRVVFHVEGDEVALVGWTTDAAGRQVLAGRVVVAAAGQALSAEQRAAHALPGPSPAITSGTLLPHLRVGTVDPSPSASLSGPFLGQVLPASVRHTTSYVGLPHRRDLVGGLVVAAGPADDEVTTTVLVSDRAGVTAGLLVRGGAEPLAAADGSVWAVVDGASVVQLLTHDWRPAG